MTALNIQLLLTGDELMAGDIVDSNSSMIAQKLQPLGLTVTKKTTVADHLTHLIAEIIHLSQQADILIINGGLGPTVDDLTAQALADACAVPLEKHPEAYQHVESWCKMKNYPLTNASIKQAMLPKGAKIIANEIGSAVGFYMSLNDCDIYCTPGVPCELESMLTKVIIPLLDKKTEHSDHIHVVKYQVFGIGESSIQQLIDDHYPNWPSEIQLGFRTAPPMLEVKLTTNVSTNRDLLAQCKHHLLSLLGDHILGEIKTTPPTMAEHLLSVLSANNKKVTTAESCTGGLIASMLTSISGSSKAFEAGFVTYSNAIKHSMLGVSNDTLAEFGAVSEPVVKAMALGAIEKSQADYAIAVSGIAGPTGGTIDKPVGTVWLAWGSRTNMQTCRFLINGNREYFQLSVAHRALDLLRRELICSNQIPLYQKQ